MDTPDHTTFRAWLEPAADGELPTDQRDRLDAHLASCPECSAELRDLERLQALLRSERLAVRPGFQQAVLAALPAAPWEARPARAAWRFPVAALVLLGGLAAALFGLGSPAAGVGSSAVGALLAVAGLLQASALAGAGLLGASWKGVGLFLQEILASPLSLGACAVLVVCLNLLLFSLVRRRRVARSSVEP